MGSRLYKMVIFCLLKIDVTCQNDTHEEVLTMALGARELISCLHELILFFNENFKFDTIREEKETLSSFT